MISVAQAQAAVLAAAQQRPSVEVPLSEAAGRFLAEDFTAPYPLPIFDQSAMDGYAVRFADLSVEDGNFGDSISSADSGKSADVGSSADPGHSTDPSRLKVAGEIKAGDPVIPVPPGEAVRIFTGAQVPAECDTIVMQEQAERNGEWVQFSGNIQPGDHIRRKGEQLAAGAIALEAGTFLDPAAIGLIGSLGVGTVNVREKVTVTMITTGSEFANSPEDLKQGKIFESNSAMIRAAVRQMGLDCRIRIVEDDLAAISQVISEEKAISQVLITTGGVSVGEYDFTTTALNQAGFETVFHKVNQKPGKPLLFCRSEEGVAFGLPGNPRSSLMGFYNYVYPYLRGAMGGEQLFLPSLELPLAEGYKKRDGKAHFVTGAIRSGKLAVSGKQNSHLLKSFVEAQVIILIPAEKDVWEAGELVQAWILPR